MGAALPLAQAAEVGSKGLPPHWPVWPPDTEGCGGHGGAPSPEARALLAPARVASCGELTPAPTHPAAGCSGYADALWAKRVKISQQSSLSTSPTDLTHQQAQARRHLLGPVWLRNRKDRAWACPVQISLRSNKGVPLHRSGPTGWARPPGGAGDKVLRKERARLRVPARPRRPTVTARQEGGGGVRLGRLLAPLRTRSAARHEADVGDLLRRPPRRLSPTSVDPAPPRPPGIGQSPARDRLGAERPPRGGAQADLAL